MKNFILKINRALAAKKKIFLLLTAVLTAGMLSAETIYGDCGENMEWEFNTGSGALYLIGTGPMDDYASFRETPWVQYRDQIKSIQKDSRSQYTTIGVCAFFGCKNLTSVDLPNTVTKISRSAFYNCSGLTSVTIPNSVTSIGNYAFYNCSGLTSVTIPNSVTSIGALAFYGSGLTSLVYNAHVFAFMPPSYSGAYTIPDGIEIIAGGAFEYCSGLTSVTIPNSVTSIGQKAFYGCRGLKTIIIPASVQTIGTAAFSNCVNLTVIQVSAINPYYSAVDGVLYNKNKTILHQFPAGKNVTSFDIPNTVTEISGYAFYGCSGLTSVTIPNSVTSIGENAFRNCSGLTSVTIPNSVTSIGNYAFDDCTGLTSPVYNAHVFAYMPSSYSGEYTIPDGIEIISSTAFYSCSNLTSVTIPNSVTSIGDYAFHDCNGLTTITCKAVNPPALGDDVFYNVDTTIPLYVPAQSVSAYLAAEQWKEFDVQADPTEAIEEVRDRHSAVSSQKVIRDGVIYIERNGKTYNAQGAEVK